VGNNVFVTYYTHGFRGSGHKPVARAVQNFRQRLQACVFKAGGHFEHSV